MNEWIVDLANESGAKVSAIVAEGITARQFNDYMHKWLPELKANLADDSHWDWQRFWAAYRKCLAKKFFTLDCEGDLQGLMLIDLTSFRSRLEPGQHIVHIDFLSAAPWNRYTQPVQRFRLVGFFLFLQAVWTSKDEGFQGRVCLHALPKVAEWYRRLGMQSFGTEPNYQDLECFELSKEAAATLLERFFLEE